MGFSDSFRAKASGDKKQVHVRIHNLEPHQKRLRLPGDQYPEFERFDAIERDFFESVNLPPRRTPMELNIRRMDEPPVRAGPQMPPRLNPHRGWIIHMPRILRLTGHRPIRAPRAEVLPRERRHVALNPRAPERVALDRSQVAKIVPLDGTQVLKKPGWAGEEVGWGWGHGLPRAARKLANAFSAISLVMTQSVSIIMGLTMVQLRSRGSSFIPNANRLPSLSRRSQQP